ncbi:di-heme oxidoredictase family protein [Marinibactrum halimedae]|uniref:Cytochrome c domain-containing protein n=1 Tax=Marinibactrum halimedae TaxID=1444977 RepID=A0AA37T9Q7_9GAMM|nr:di-heme oxidoredictase family protein [Marinibactrum halimedae]MCD9457623.1 family 31 carbohydrate-binding protein [Marinibactrum halimedae]GLS28044.1 hypothetical protein GCM10007877_37630 [Marinibactrum halimedae]
MTTLRKQLMLAAVCTAMSINGNVHADEGIRATGPDSGVIYFQDNNYSGLWNFICLNSEGNCQSGEKVNGYWERPVNGLTDGSTYNISAKIQDNSQGQILTGFIPVTFDSSVTSGGSVGGDTGGGEICTGADIPSANISVTHETDVDFNDGSLSFSFSPTTGRSSIQFSIDGGNNYDYSADLSDGSLDIINLAPGDYGVSARWGNGECPTVLDTITIIEATPTGETCTGSDIPAATLSKIDESSAGANDGSIIFSFNDDASSGGTRSTIEFSVDGGTSYPYRVPDNSGSTTVSNLAPGIYNTWARWGNNECPTSLGSIAIVGGDDDGGSCGEPDVDYPADFGEGYAFGMTTSGLVYHSAMPNHGPGFAILGLISSGANLPETGPFTYTTSTDDDVLRYETQVPGVNANTTYTLEIRLQGDQFGGGQCIHSINVKPGEGVSTSPCFVSNGGGQLPPSAPKAAVGTLIENGGQSARLIGGAGSVSPNFALYTFANDTNGSSNCEGSCAEQWPPLTIADAEDLVGAGGVTGGFDTITRTEEVTDDCGNTTVKTVYQVTYNGKPLYFFSNDTGPSSTNGANIPNWDLASAELIPQLPLVDYPAPALKTAVNGIIPRSYGMAIDIEDRTVTWRAGTGLTYQFSFVSDTNVRSPKDPSLEFWCSNNQIQFHKSDMPGTLEGPYSTEIPGACYGKFYYFLRYRIRGTVNAEPEDNWVYTALFEYDETQPNDRINPEDRPTITHTSANWQRHGHPHSRDRPEEFITFDAMPYNTSLLSGLERYTSTYIDGPGTAFRLQPNASVAPMRIEAFEWGAGNCQGPQYIINGGNPIPAEGFDYGQIVSWEATFPTSNNSKFGGTSISSQIYNTMQNVTVGMGFSTATGDPRLNSAGRGGVRMVHANGCNPVEQDERNAKFAQQLTTVESDVMVNDFILGHNLFHGMADVSQAKPGGTGLAGSVEIRDVNGVLVKSAGVASCGDCHVRDGRSEFVFNTPKGPRIAPPTYGVGLLQWIEGAEVGLTWDGSVATVEEQSEIALSVDLGLTPAQIGADNFDKIVEYTRTLHVPVRPYDSYTDPEVEEGEVAFYNRGCADCHTPTAKTRSDAPVELRDIYIRPYTDMKLWDVGTGGKFRTAPLWGIGQNIEMLERMGMNQLYLHDGRATTLESAISAHSNAGSDMNSIVKFLRSL